MKTWSAKSLLVLACAVFSLKVQAQTVDLQTFSLEGTASADSSVEAAKEIQSEVIAENVRAQVLAMIGEKRFAKFKGQIEARIIKQSAKFIPFVKPGVAVKQADGEWKMSVEFKLSQSSLRKMVQAAGFLNDDDGPASVLPIVTFTDRDHGASLRWWQGQVRDESHKLTTDVSGLFYDKFQIELSRQGFHLIKPFGSEHSPLPEVFQTEKPSTQDLAFFSEYFQSPMVMTGQVSFKKSKDSSTALCSVQLQVVQVLSVTNTRVVAEVAKQFVSDAGNYENQLRGIVSSEFPELGKDLSTQVLEAWQRGSLSSNLLKLTVRGALTPKNLAQLKSELLQAMPEIKSMKERVLTASGALGDFVFEVDYSGEAAALSEHLGKLRLASFDAQVANRDTRTIEMKVKAHAQQNR